MLLQPDKQILETDLCCTLTHYPVYHGHYHGPFVPQWPLNHRARPTLCTQVHTHLQAGTEIPLLKLYLSNFFSSLAFVLPSLIFAWRLTSVPASALFSSCTVRVMVLLLPHLHILSFTTNNLLCSLHGKVLKWKRACQGLGGSRN